MSGTSAMVSMPLVHHFDFVRYLLALPEGLTYREENVSLASMWRVGVARMWCWYNLVELGCLNVQPLITR